MSYNYEVQWCMVAVPITWAAALHAGAAVPANVK